MARQQEGQGLCFIVQHDGHRGSGVDYRRELSEQVVVVYFYETFVRVLGGAHAMRAFPS